MMERIISDECLASINQTAYMAGQAGKEVYTQRGADGEEITRCRDCKCCSETIKFSDGEHGSDCGVVSFCDKLRRETKPNGFCAWAERRDDD